ncbi:hypothetical protein [Micromonospora globispora]|nr:hypothetical protein [Micromonospora globispora]
MSASATLRQDLPGQRGVLLPGVPVDQVPLGHAGRYPAAAPGNPARRRP